MGVEQLIYPTINLFQYNLRQSLGDREENLLDRSRSFYQKFLPDPTDRDLLEYRDREQSDGECNELLSTDRSSLAYQSLPQPLDGFYYPVQLGDTYVLHLNYSGKLDRDKPDKQPKDFRTAVSDLELEKILPPLDGNSFGQTRLLTAFIDNYQIDKLEIAQACDRQITGKSATNLARSMSSGQWMGGEIFEFWTPPLSLQGNDLQDIVNRHPHTIVWLFPAAKLAEIDREIIPNTYQDWMKLLHYRHKIFYVYYQSRSIEQKLKQANTRIRKIADRLKSQNTSLQHLQSLLFDTLTEFQSYSENVQALADQQYTIETNRDNYRSLHEVMTQTDPGCDLQFLLEFETKYGNKYNRQIIADRAHLDSGLQVLENLSQTIQGIIQIEQTKSDRVTNLLIASVGSGLAVSQVVCAIVLAQNSPDKKENFYQTSVFQLSLVSGLMVTILIFLISVAWVKLRRGK